MKVPLSRCSTPDTGWEAIKHSTRGSELIWLTEGIKNANGNRLANYSSPVLNVEHCKYRDCFWMGNHFRNKTISLSDENTRSL